MATSLGDLLDTLVAAAHTQQITREDAHTRADAANALGHLGRALELLRVDGLSPAIGDIRDRQIRDLGRSCRTIAAIAPVAEGRLTLLAAAAADTVGVLRIHLTNPDRWAAAVAFVDTLDPLCALIDPSVTSGTGSVALRLAELRRHSLSAEQSAAGHPPISAALDHPIPAVLRADIASAPTAIREASRTVAYFTANSDQMRVIDVLAVAVAAETLSGAATRCGKDSENGQVSAADGWKAAQSALTPFIDGNPGPRAASPLISAARDLHHAIRRGTRDINAQHADPQTDGDGGAWAIRTAIAEATQFLPAIATDLRGNAARWAQTSELIAYACNLPVREETLTQWLAGRRPAGVIRADAVDLHQVNDALHVAKVLSVDLAARTTPTTGATFPTRAWATHRSTLREPHAPAAVDEAQAWARRQLHATNPASPRRGR